MSTAREGAQSPTGRAICLPLTQDAEDQDAASWTPTARPASTAVWLPTDGARPVRLPRVAETAQPVSLMKC